MPAVSLDGVTSLRYYLKIKPKTIDRNNQLITVYLVTGASNNIVYNCITYSISASEQHKVLTRGLAEQHKVL